MNRSWSPARSTSFASHLLTFVSPSHTRVLPNPTLSQSCAIPALCEWRDRYRTMNCISTLRINTVTAAPRAWYHYFPISPLLEIHHVLRGVLRARVCFPFGRVNKWFAAPDHATPPNKRSAVRQKPYGGEA